MRVARIDGNNAASIPVVARNAAMIRQLHTLLTPKPGMDACKTEPAIAATRAARPGSTTSRGSVSLGAPPGSVPRAALACSASLEAIRVTKKSGPQGTHSQNLIWL